MLKTPVLNKRTLTPALTHSQQTATNQQTVY
jgi:hypothetical protein